MKPKILTVDDSRTIRLIVAKAFKAFDCDMYEAGNGLEGLAVATRERPDVIILDVNMPVMDGIEMLAKLKFSAELKNVPVIMLSTEASRETVLRVARMGVRDYVIKPFKEDQLVERIGRMIELRPRSEALSRVKRFDDPLNLLLVDDKPAILEQLRAGLGDTTWSIHGRNHSGEALDFCSQNCPEAILISLSLPDSNGFTLFQMLRASSKTKGLPIFGLCVKTATEEQSRAQQTGFTGIITKPIDIDDVKGKIARALNLDTSYKYFEQRDGVLVLKVPAQFTPAVANEIGVHLRSKVAEAVDAGMDKMVVDFSQVRSADINLVRLGLSAVQLCHELALKQRIIGSEAIQGECRNYEETKDWNFTRTFDDAVGALSGCAEMAA